MPVAGEEFKQRNMLPDHELLRRVVCTEGELELQFDFQPAADYATKRVRVRNLGACGLRLDVGRGSYWLRSNTPILVQGDCVHARIVLKRGDELQFSLSYAEESPAALPLLGEPARAAIDRSVAWWQQWARKSSYHGHYRDAVTRSALVLKLLAYAPSGAIIAAPTTSLPERAGDNLNWDYRYCWLRDASLTVRALLGLGHANEAESFLAWLLHATRLTQPELRILYTVFGEIAPRERELEHLSGYLDSPPIRIGNGARSQLQLDVYGEVIDASAQYARLGGRFDRSRRWLIRKMLLRKTGRADEGIWSRGQPRNQHTRDCCADGVGPAPGPGQERNPPSRHAAPTTAEQEQIRQQITVRAWNEHLTM
jgi:hypothetical protein